MLQHHRAENIEEVLALTPVQRGMVFETLTAPKSGVYTGLFHAALPPDLDIPRFKAAWRQSVARHPALRTIIQTANPDGPMQVVLKSLPDDIWREESLNDKSVDERLDEIHSLQVDFEHAPALGLFILEDNEGQRWFAWASHHALVDDWSAVSVLREVNDFYFDEHKRGADALTPFSAFVKWQAAQDTSAAEEYWRETIGDFETPSTLQLLQRDTRQKNRSNQQSIETTLSEATTQRLAETAKSLRVTPAPLMAAVWSILLHRLSSQDDVMFGLAVTQRPPEITGIQSAVGNFVAVAPMRARLNTVRDLKALILSQAHASMSAVEHSLVPINRLQEISGVPREETLFDTVLSIESTWAAAFASDQRRTLFPDLAARDKSHYPIAVLIAPGKKLSIRVQYDAARYAEETAQRVLSMLTHALENVPGYVDRSPLELPVAPPPAPTRAHEAPPTLPHNNVFIHEAFRTCAKENPTFPTLITSNETLDYSALDQLSDAWARQLIDRNLGPGDCVAILIDRSINAVSAILATLKAGCAYVPVDPGNPAQRTAQILEDCGAKAVFTEKKHDATLVRHQHLVIHIDDEPPPVSETPFPIRPLTPEHTAYVIYTSGSTGAPKGVAVSHANLSYSTAARLQFYGETPKSFLLLSPIIFDSSVAGLFWTLATGGALALPAPGEETDVKALADLIKSEKVTHTLGLPSLLASIAEFLPAETLTSMRTVIAAGETLTATAVTQLKTAMPSARIYNEYGPTEATVWCLAHEATQNHETSVPIGAPIPGALTQIRDAHGRLVPDGLPGELFVGGPGVAQGYLNNEIETARKFISDKEPPHHRWYATGDLVRQRFDGCVEFLGRIDGQLKIRGHRIEPSEIEAVLMDRPEVRETAVKVFDHGGEKRLVAFVAANNNQRLSIADLKVHMRNALPAWMQPDQIVIFEALPRTATGKLDRAALAEPDICVDEEKRTPITPLEKTLATIWQEALKLDRTVGVTENFFDLGGNSLAAMRLLNTIEGELNEKLPFSIIGRISTIEEQAQQIKSHRGALLKSAHKAATPDERDTIVPLSDEEAAMLRSYTDNWPGKPAFENSLFRVLNENGSAPPLVWCFNNGHEFSRLASRLGAGQPVYGLRSGNLVLDITPKNQRTANKRVALHALPELLRILPEGPYYLGGNCQGAAIAMELALSLQSLDHAVALVMLMEAVHEAPFSGRVALIFGKDSIFNPYAAEPDPDSQWKRMYDRYTVDIIPGQHGTYFDRPRIGALAKAVARALQTAHNDFLGSPFPSKTHYQPSAISNLVSATANIFRR